MKADTACDLIAGITYRPEWDITSHYVEPEVIALICTVRVRQSDVSCAPYYLSHITIRKVFVLDISVVHDDNELYRVVFGFIELIETHEAREFFSVDGKSYRKPFHPHTHDGRALWDDAYIDEQYDLS